MLYWLLKFFLGKTISSALYHSTLNGGTRPSSRKMVAYALLFGFMAFQLVFIYLLIKKEVTPELLVEFRWILLADLLGAFLLLGVVTVQQIISLTKDKSITTSKISAQAEIKTKQIEQEKEIKLAKVNSNQEFKVNEQSEINIDDLG